MKKIETNNKASNTYIIAEIGNNHEGNFLIAEKLIDKASYAGVDAVKFQFFNIDYYLSKEVKKSRINQLKKFSLNFN